MLIRTHRLLFALLLLPSLALPAGSFVGGASEVRAAGHTAGVAAARATGPADDTQDWVEMPVGRFVVIYPAHLESELAEAATRYGQAADSAYDQFSRLYGPSPPLPINIRIYENQEQFVALNAVVPPLGQGMFHTHVGTREIALVAPFPFDYLQADIVSNAMRHELNGLFLSSLSNGNLPAGLEVGIDQYVEAPGQQMDQTRSQLLAAVADGLLLPWSQLFESTDVYTDTQVAYPQSLSVAAFLVDSYGYGTLIDMVKATASGQGYRSAFAGVYGRPMDRLESEWENYLPEYVQTRWQYNALFNYDLAPFEAAIQAGAFTQTARGLDEVIPWLELTGQVKAQAQAVALRDLAGKGIAASTLVQSEREALQNGDYEGVLALAEQARAAFAEVGSQARLDEIRLYESRARELISLRGQLAEAQKMIANGQASEAEIRLTNIAARLRTLGDDDTAQTAEALLADLRARQATESLLARLAVGGLVALVVGHRAVSLYRRRRQGSKKVAIL